MNHMKDIIKILGVKFNEEFYLTKHSNTRFVITPGGMFSQDENKDWHESPLLYDILLGKYEIKKIPQPVLTEEEKEYLSYVIKPFRDKIDYIRKNIPYYYFNEIRDLEYIEIKTDDNHSMYFPYFKANSMYKGMTLDRRYSLEELGL